jgi:cytoskeletal protein CcmA (bactofilin family)
MRGALRGAVILLGVVAALAVGGAAAARSGEGDPFVVLTGTLQVPQDATVSDAVIFHGDATVEGTVTGNVVALDGDVRIDGDVRGDAVAVNGRVVVGSSGHVHGDVVSSLEPEVSGTVDGATRRTVGPGTVDWERFTAVSRFAIWVGTTVSSFVLGLLLVLFAPRAAEAIAATGLRRAGASFGWGALVLVGTPIVALISFVTVVGIPFGFGVLLALGLLYWLGWVSGALVLGRRLVRAPASRVGAFAAGWGILRLLALIPFVGGLVWLVTTCVGLGALVLAARGANRTMPASPAAMPPPPVAV